MNPDAHALGALFVALGEIPARVASLERQSAEMLAKLGQLESALPSKLLTIKEAAILCHVSTSTVRRWAKDRKIPTLEIESTVRVDVSRLAAQMTGNSH